MNQYNHINQLKDTYRNDLPEPDPGWPPRVQRVMAFIIAHLFDPRLTVGWMRKECGINGHNFTARFASCTGRALKDFINYHRVEVAKKLLADPGLQKVSASAISYEVGFSGPAVFSNVFKSRTGAPPSVWRNQHR